jgi:hypothetical protein
MNAALKQEIIDAYRISGMQIPEIAKFYGCTETQVERIIFPNGKGPKMLPVVIPKIAKEVTTLIGAEGVIRIPGKPKRLVPLSESKLKIPPVAEEPSKKQRQVGTEAGKTPSKAKTPEGRLGALKAWETIRKQRAEAKGETYTPRSLEELKRIAGIMDTAPQQPVPKVVTPQPIAVQPAAKPEAELKPKQAMVVPTPKDDELDIDYKPTVQAGRIVTAYCEQQGITVQELLEAHQQLMIISKLVKKPS